MLFLEMVALIVAAIMGFVLLATAIVNSIVSFRNLKQTQQIHVLVNSRMEGMEARVRQLILALEGSNTEVPKEDAR